MAVVTRRERFFQFNGLVCLAQAVEGKYTTVDLRNETSVTGKIEQVDGFMNIVMSDSVFIDARGAEYPFESFFIQARNVRYIHIPDKTCKRGGVSHMDMHKISPLIFTGCMQVVGRLRSVSGVTVIPCKRGLAENLKPRCRSLTSFSTQGDRKLQIMSQTSKFMTDSTTEKNTNKFRLSDYDCIGFDLDNTLCKYKITEMVTLEYEVLSKYLVTEKGYDAEYLLKPLELNMDFLQKGLMLDFYNGNVLQVGSNCYINRASHGTKFMSDKEIEEIYGPERKWDVTTQFCQNMLEAWNGPVSERVRSLSDYFDMPASLAFARIVDSLDAKEGKRLGVYNVWPDVLDGLVYMFKREHFSTNEGGYFPALKAEPPKYINRCSNNVVNWLKQLRNSKVTFLLTGSNVDFASLTASHSLGENWRDLFHIVVCYSRKPGFFTGARPFLKLEDIVEQDPIGFEELKPGNLYSQGNWQDLYQFLVKTSGKTQPKCLYIGDNLVQDIYTPSEYTRCDTVAVVEEMAAEGMNASKEFDLHADSLVLKSSSWGSYFASVGKDGKKDLTLWGEILNKYSKMCVPSLDVLASQPIDLEMPTFNNKDGSDIAGYYPAVPLSLS